MTRMLIKWWCIYIGNHEHYEIKIVKQTLILIQPRERIWQGVEQTWATVENCDDIPVPLQPFKGYVLTFLTL